MRNLKEMGVGTWNICFLNCDMKILDLEINWIILSIILGKFFGVLLNLSSFSIGFQFQSLD